MPPYATQFFTARFQTKLCGVIIFSMPNTFSKILGVDTRKMERLISRGATISFAPKGLGSSLLMWAIRWTVQNMRYRLFVGYSDPEALELGTIYSASNFFYMGQTSGSIRRYKLSTGKWVSDRYFSTRSVFKKMAQREGIVWQNHWIRGGNIVWKNVPDEIEEKIRKAAKELMNSCESRIVPPKHKFAIVLGRSKKETRELIQRFVHLNPHLFHEVADESEADAHKDVNFDIRKRLRAGDTTCKFRKRIAYPKIRGS